MANSETYWRSFVCVLIWMRIPKVIFFFLGIMSIEDLLGWRSAYYSWPWKSTTKIISLCWGAIISPGRWPSASISIRKLSKSIIRIFTSILWTSLIYFHSLVSLIISTFAYMEGSRPKLLKFKPYSKKTEEFRFLSKELSVTWCGLILLTVLKAFYKILISQI